MDWETLVAGGGTGFVATILTLLGWDRRIKKVEESKVDGSLCDERHELHQNNIRNLTESLNYIKSRVDKLIDIQLNGKK